MHEFGHNSIKTEPLGSSVHRALNNIESVLVGVCFAFLMYSYGSTELHDLDLRHYYSARGTAVHILDSALVVHGHFVICL